MDPDEIRSERSQKLYDELNDKIVEYVNSIFEQ